MGKHSPVERKSRDDFAVRNVAEPSMVEDDPFAITRHGEQLDRFHSVRRREFAERHLVVEMALHKWRLFRTYGMEKSVYERQLATFKPASAIA